MKSPGNVSALTMFSFGYWGWGTATDKLVKAIDAVERFRGFNPPVFVDVRLQRSVRAPGFDGRAFEEQLGAKRHYWLPGLGNENIRSRTGPPIQIANPHEANTLLGLALAAAHDGRRVIFFCSCQWARDGKFRCHRTEVASLLLKAASRTGRSLTVVEWPGGEPTSVRFSVDERVFKRLQGDGWYVSSPRNASEAKVVGLPWGSVAVLKNGKDSMHAVTGSAVWKQSEWQLPIFFKSIESEAISDEVVRESKAFRRLHGFLPRST